MTHSLDPLFKIDLNLCRFTPHLKLDRKSLLFRNELQCSVPTGGVGSSYRKSNMWHKTNPINHFFKNILIMHARYVSVSVWSYFTYSCDYL